MEWNGRGGTPVKMVGIIPHDGIKSIRIADTGGRDDEGEASEANISDDLGWAWLAFCLLWFGFVSSYRTVWYRACLPPSLRPITPLLPTRPLPSVFLGGGGVMTL